MYIEYAQEFTTKKALREHLDQLVKTQIIPA